MSFALTAATRTEVGKRVKNVRNAGSIPAIMYGHGVEPKAITLGVSEFQKVYRAAGMSSLIDIAIDTTAPVKVLIQEVQVNPLTMRPQHVDLRQIRMDEELTVDVPLTFVNESPAVKGLAGTLMTPMAAITVKCLPANLPHSIEVDLAKLVTFEDSITIADLAMPTGVTATQDANVTIASVTPPLTEEQLKKMEEEGKGDVTAIKTEAEEKKAAEEAKKAEESAAEAAAA